MIRTTVRVLACLAVLAVAGTAPAQDVPLDERARIEGYVKLLGDDAADVRQRAEDALVELGADVRPFVVLALEDANTEVRHRARAVLDRLEAVAKSATGVDLTWAGLRGGPERTGVAGGDLPAARPEAIWRADVPHIELMQGSVVPGPDVVACLSRDGVIRGFDTETGSSRWLAHLDTEITASAVLAADRLVVPTKKGLIALDLRTGRKAWEHVADYGCDAAPAVRGGRVFAAFKNDGVRAFDLGTGEQEFRRPVAPSGALLLDGDVLIVGTEDGELLRIHPDSGRVVWRKDIGSAPNMGPTLGAEGIVVVLAENRYLRAFSTSRGRLLWERRLTAGSRSESLAAGGGRLFLSDSRGALLGFDAGTGVALWNRHEGMLELGGPCVTSERVLWGARGRIVCRSARSGTIQWRLDLPVPDCSVPAARDGTVFVLTDRSLLALR